MLGYSEVKAPEHEGLHDEAQTPQNDAEQEFKTGVGREADRLTQDIKALQEKYGLQFEIALTLLVLARNLSHSDQTEYPFDL